jgi:hypothetical protein
MLTAEEHLDNLVRHIGLVREAGLMLGKRQADALTIFAILGLTPRERAISVAWRRKAQRSPCPVGCASGSRRAVMADRVKPCRS